MYKEIELDSAGAQDVVNGILLLEHSDEALVVRKGRNLRLSRDDWYKLLTEQCGLTLDMRHYSFDEKIALDYWWEISNQPEKEKSYAYSTTPQPFHNDNAWFSDPAEINVFYMEKQAAAGGEQLIYPAARLIDDLRRLDPVLLHDLVHTRVIIRKGSDAHQNITPIVVLENGGRVYWNYYRTIKTDPSVSVLCDRFFEFLRKQEDSSSIYSVRCETGDSLAFHDQRVLHARTSFVASAPRDRILYQSMWRLPRRAGPPSRV